MQAGFQLAEPYPVIDQYVDGLGRIEVTGQNFRFVLYTTKENEDGSSHEIVARVVMPADSVLPAIKMVLTMKFFQLIDVAAMLCGIAEKTMHH